MGQKVQKMVEVPQVQYIDRVVDVPVVKQRHVPAIQKVQKTVVQHRQVPSVQKVQKTVEVPQVQTVAGATKSVNLPSAPVRQTAPAEVVQVTEVGPPLPAESAPATRSVAPMAAPVVAAAPVTTVGGLVGGFSGGAGAGLSGATYGAAGVGGGFGGSLSGAT